MSKIEQKCKEKGVRLTDQRKVIAKILSESKEEYGSKDHPDVDELHKRVTKIDDKIRGWYWLNYEANESFNLYVHENFRGRGYGFGLISYIITAAKLRQLDCVWAQVDDWNEVSQKLFLRCGFVSE